MSKPDLSEILMVAKEASLLTSTMLSDAFNSGIAEVSEKADGSVVTDLDVRAEKEIRACLSAKFDDRYAIEGEELDDTKTDRRYRWLIDPIDGTLNFTRGIPTFGTLIAFEDRDTGRALAGAIHLPVSGVTYYAAAGLGAFRDDRKIFVSPDRQPDQAIVSTSDVYQFRAARLEKEFGTLRDTFDVLRGYGDCWAHALVAEGAIDASVEPYLNRWDFAATEVLVHEAGGLCLSRRSDTDNLAYDAIFGSRKLVEMIASMISF